MRIRRLQDGAPRLPLGAPYLGGDREADRRRMQANPIRKLYSTARWRALRWQVLLEAHVRCAKCGREHPRLSRLCDRLAPLGLLHTVAGAAPDFAADHIEPHRGDLGRFWDRANLQCLCAGCHAGAKQREEQGSRGAAGGGGGV